MTVYSKSDKKSENKSAAGITEPDGKEGEQNE